MWYISFQKINLLEATDAITSLKWARLQSAQDPASPWQRASPHGRRRGTQCAQAVRGALGPPAILGLAWVRKATKLIRYYFLLKKLVLVVVDLLFMLVDFGKGPEYDPFWSQTGQTWHAGQHSRVGQKGSQRVNITDHLVHSDTSRPFWEKIEIAPKHRVVPFGLHCQSRRSWYKYNNKKFSV